MDKKIKIKVSLEAYKQLLDAINFDNEYNCIRLEPSEKKCCKSSKVNLILDNKKPLDIVEKIDDLTFSFDDNLVKLFKEIIIVISNGDIYVKAVKANKTTLENNINCSTCSGCSGCSKKRIIN